MPSFRYFELDPKASEPFLNMKINDVISTNYQLPIPDVYSTVETSVKCVGQSVSSGYVKYLVRCQEYLRSDGKRSNKPSSMIATKTLYIYKPADEDYIFIKGEQSSIKEIIKALSDYNLLKVKYYSIDLAKYEEDNNIEIYGGWISDDSSTIGYFKKPNSREYTWIEKKMNGGNPSNIIFPLNLANTALTVRLNKNGNIFFAHGLDEEYEFYILDLLFMQLKSYMLP